MVRGQILIATIGLLGLFAATGCDFFDAFKPGSGQTVVNVFTTHHATPENGVVPDRGGEGEARVFDNDEGWTVSLLKGYITTRGVTLHRCDGDEMPIDVYFGSLAEDLSDADLDRLTIGGTEVGRVELCGMTVHYGPFDGETDDAPDGASVEDVDGNTLVLAGFARRGEDTVPFDIRSEVALDVHIDLSTGPVRVSGNEDFPVELTLAKTYDRFFDGIDFGAISEEELEAQVTAVLELETRFQAN